MIFPKLVYKSETSYRLVSDDAEMTGALAEGWFKTVPEALESKTKPVVAASAEKTPEAPKKALEPEKKPVKLASVGKHKSAWGAVPADVDKDI